MQASEINKGVYDILQPENSKILIAHEPQFSLLPVGFVICPTLSWLGRASLSHANAAHRCKHFCKEGRLLQIRVYGI